MTDSLNLYLKYFHDGKKFEDLLQQIESENENFEQGTSSNEHIDQLHPDQKVLGGIDKEIAIPFTRKSYKAASRKRTKGKMYESYVKIRQDKYSNTGNAWKVWDSALVQARWVFSNRDLFQGKKVHEIGSGCGLVGIVASMFCEEITLSDYKEEILQNIENNIQLNVDGSPATKSNLIVRKLDFQDVAEGKVDIQEAEKVDIVLGADILYGLHLGEWVPHVVDKLLKEDGVFYCVNPKNRWGLDLFLEVMDKLGFECKIQTTSEEYSDDFAKKSFWDLITCYRRTPISK